VTPRGVGGKPGRHDTFGNYLSNHPGIFLCLIIMLEAEGADPSFAVAFHAVGFQYA